tara:strand:+ start:130 stop:378 length:249 start_codon:yes stop_codon:yes gene_type:complete
MTGIRTPKDEDELRRFQDAVRRGLGVPLEAFIEAIIGHKPEQHLVEDIRFGIESQIAMPDDSPPLDIKAYILEHIRWLEFNS